MGILNNSGDIILDAVLTDTGRERLARGDGSFKVAKFALSDDEINYGTYDKNHASGSSYFDIQVLMSPVFEAFTNNASVMNSKLISVSRQNLLYLPVIKLDETSGEGSARHTSNVWVVCVDDTTENELWITGSANNAGILFGENPSRGRHIKLDQGLDTSEIPPQKGLPQDLRETQYMVRIDNRFGEVVSTAMKPATANISYIDDDNLATYLLNLGTDPAFVNEITDVSTESNQAIAGPRGTSLKFRLRSGQELNSSDYLFDELGSTTTINGNTQGPNYANIKFIDSLVRVEGATTGFKVDIPVRFVKWRSTY